MTKHNLIKVFENSFIENLVRKFPRSPHQLNRLQESDAELLKIPETETILALTTDGIAEEIETGLYSDPYLIGWMAVMVCVSDLAAVGAKPIGILINETLPRGLHKEFLEKLQNGIKDACAECEIFVLGGDTNFSTNMQISASALGLIAGKSLISRVGCKEGEYLFTTGKFGHGSSYAFRLLSLKKKKNNSLSFYKPKARIREGQFIRDFASSCMDTSDGFLTTIDQLMRLNYLGFVIDVDLEGILHPDALLLAQDKQIPHWMFLAGPHGEFELLFTIPQNIYINFLKKATSAGFDFKPIGKAVKAPGLYISSNGSDISIDTSKVRNLFDEVEGNIEKYIHKLFEFDRQW